MFIITVGTTIFFKSIKAIATKFHPDCIAHEKQKTSKILLKGSTQGNLNIQGYFENKQFV